MKKRSIVGMLLLSIFTFGIYTAYWHFKFQNEIREKTGEGLSGGLHLIACLFTFGIYFVYWNYVTGKRLAKLGADDFSVLYLVVSIISLSWICQLVMQHQANSID